MATFTNQQLADRVASFHPDFEEIAILIIQKGFTGANLVDVDTMIDAVEELPRSFLQADLCREWLRAKQHERAFPFLYDDYEENTPVA